MIIKKRKVLIIAIIAVLICIIMMIFVNKTKKKASVQDISSRPVSEIIAETNQKEKEKISTQFSENLEEANNSVSSLFNQIGNNITALDDYANDLYINVKYGTIDEIEEYAQDSLDESINFYDIEGNKIDVKKVLYNENEEAANESNGTVQGIPLPKYNGNVVELSNNIYKYKIGDYCLIKYYVPFSNYTYYFISQLTSSGFRNFQLYVISTNEVYNDGNFQNPSIENKN